LAIRLFSFSFGCCVCVPFFPFCSRWLCGRLFFVLCSSSRNAVDTSVASAPEIKAGESFEDDLRAFESGCFRSAVVLFQIGSRPFQLDLLLLLRSKEISRITFPSIFPPTKKKNSASAESELKARQASARAWVTPWLEARKKGGSGSAAAAAAAEPKKPNRPAAAAAASASASAPSKPAAAKPAAGGKVKGGEVMADGSVMYRF
jgi:hypothetical protein